MKRITMHRCVYIRFMFIVCIIASCIETICSASSEVTKQNFFANKILKFDRSALYEQAVKESLVPIREGVLGKIPFWNVRARQFMYAPAFDFNPVEGTTVYRFTATAWREVKTIETKEPKISMSEIWKELPHGNLELRFMAIGAKRGDALRIGGPDVYKSVKSFTKQEGTEPPSFEFSGSEGAMGYQFIVLKPVEFVFEADSPWASLTPIWKDLPVGRVILKVEGLSQKGGKVFGIAGTKEFVRKAVFNGTYHEAVSDYIESGVQWLRWLAQGEFKLWTKEGDPHKLQQYPCKYEASAVEGLTALSMLEREPGEKEKLLSMAKNAACTLIKGSFPADWSLAHLPPTYKGGGGYKYEVVMMNYPATAGKAYLELYDITHEKEFLDAANNKVFLRLAEDALRLAEGQFVIWEQPPYPEQFTPCALEQYMYMVSIQASAELSINV